MSTLTNLLHEEQLRNLFDLGIQNGAVWILRALAALLLFLVGRRLARLSREVTRRGLTKVESDPTLVPFLTGLVYYSVLFVVFLTTLPVVGIPIFSLTAVLGAIGLAVALSLKDTLSHFASGILLLSFKPLRVGEVVEVAGTTGTVNAVGLFQTVLVTGDNVVVNIPNSKIWQDSVLNYSRQPQRRIDLEIGVGYGDDLERALEIARQTVLADPRVFAEPPPVVAVNSLGDSSVNLVVRPWCKNEDYWPLRRELILRLKQNLEAGGCSIPFPQRDLHVVSWPGEPPAAPGSMKTGPTNAKVQTSPKQQHN